MVWESFTPEEKQMTSILTAEENEEFEKYLKICEVDFLQNTPSSKSLSNLKLEDQYNYWDEVYADGDDKRRRKCN